MTWLALQLMWFAIGFGTGAVVAVISRWGVSHMAPGLRTSPEVRTTLGILIFVAVICALLLSWFQREQLARVTACQAQYNSDVASIITERAKLNSDDREATTTLIIGVFTPPPNLTQQERSQRAERLFRTWKKAEDNYQARLAADRFPSLKNRCG